MRQCKACGKGKPLGNYGLIRKGSRREYMEICLSCEWDQATDRSKLWAIIEGFKQLQGED